MCVLEGSMRTIDDGERVELERLAESIAHRCLHELGFGLERGGDGAPVFTDPQGRVIHADGRMYSTACSHTDLELPLAPWPVTEEAVDYDACIEALLQAGAELACA